MAFCVVGAHASIHASNNSITGMRLISRKNYLGPLKVNTGMLPWELVICNVNLNDVTVDIECLHFPMR